MARLVCGVQQRGLLSVVGDTATSRSSANALEFPAQPGPCSAAPAAPPSPLRWACGDALEGDRPSFAACLLLLLLLPNFFDLLDLAEAEDFADLAERPDFSVFTYPGEFVWLAICIHADTRATETKVNPYYTQAICHCRFRPDCVRVAQRRPFPRAKP